MCRVPICRRGHSAPYCYYQCLMVTIIRWRRLQWIDIGHAALQELQGTLQAGLKVGGLQGGGRPVAAHQAADGGGGEGAPPPGEGPGPLQLTSDGLRGVHHRKVKGEEGLRVSQVVYA
jgi:hypothetical protein